MNVGDFFLGYFETNRFEHSTDIYIGQCSESDNNAVQVPFLHYKNSARTTLLFTDVFDIYAGTTMNVLHLF